MSYCLNDTGEVIVGFKKMSPHDIVCIFNRQLKYGLFAQIFMSQTFSMVKVSMK